MSAGESGLGGLFAILELSDFRDFVALALRVLLSIAGGVLGWYVSRPLARVICRAAFHCPISPKALTLSRVGGAILFGVLVFFLFPLGFGGGGGGTGDGKGAGIGPKNTGEGDKDGKLNKDGKDGQGKGETKGTLRIEMVLTDNYKKDNRWYLIEAKEPARTLGEVEDYLKRNKAHLEKLEIIIYGNSVDPGNPVAMPFQPARPPHRAVAELMELAETKYKLPTYRPREYWSKTKSE